MPDAFIPLTPPAVKPAQAGFVSMSLQGTSTASAPSSGVAPNIISADQVACSKPVITLQRDGQTVSSIRIQCGCGQVIELNCVY